MIKQSSLSKHLATVRRPKQEQQVLPLGNQLGNPFRHLFGELFWKLCWIRQIHTLIWMFTGIFKKCIIIEKSVRKKNRTFSKCSDFVPKKKKLIHTKYDLYSLAAVLQLELLTVQFMPLIDPCSVVHVSLEYFKRILTSRIKSLNPTLNVKHWYKNVHSTQTAIHHT